MKNRKHNLPRLMGKVFMEPWAILPSKLDEIGALLEAHVRGELNITQLAMSESGEAEKDHEPYEIHGSIALIRACGIVGKRLGWLELMCGAFDLDHMAYALRMARSDSRVRAILIDFDSPGGTVTGTPEAAELIAETAEIMPVIGYSETQMCSAAYWMGAACSELFCASSATLGSIGVIIAGVEDYDRWKKEGLKAQIFVSGELKAVGRPGTPWTEAHLKFLQASVDQTFAEFTAHINAHRPGVPAEAMTGGWYSGADIERYDLADGFVPDLSTMVDTLASQF